MDQTPDAQTARVEGTEIPAAPVRLVELAMELGETADALALRLGRDVFRDSVGFRCVTAFRASRLFTERDRRLEEVARRQKETRERLRAGNEANPVMRGVRITAPEGMPPVAVLTASAPAVYDDPAFRPIPSRLDWQFGTQGDGASIGPTPQEVRAAAQQRAAERRRAKEGRQ